MFTVSSLYRPRLQSLRRSISMLLLAVVTCSIIGVPFLAPGPEKVGRFPCENGVCGCATAEACWDKCCCHSDVEKLAWAATHHVSPPAFLVARVSAAQKLLILVKQTADQPTTRHCCCSRAAPVACSTATGSEFAGVDSSAKHAPGLRFVSLEDAAKCRGITWLWSLLADVVVAESNVLGAAAEPRLLFCLAIENEHVIDRAYCPDPPVP